MARTKKSDKPAWLKYSEEEVKSIIQKLANKGLTSEKIGLVLRDQYGIPKVKLYGLKIKKVIEEKLDEQHKFEEPTLINLNKRAEKISKHYEKNKGDKKAQRSLTIIKANLKKRKDYLTKKTA
jgi:small subunit ribosomal protein S15